MDKLTLFTPVGIASYPHITQADTKFGACFKTSLRLNPADEGVQEFIDKVRKYEENALVYLIDEAKGKAKAELKANGLKNTKLEEEYDADGELTGSYIMEAKCKAEYVIPSGDRKGQVIDLAPKLFDADGGYISGPRPAIGAGSKLKLQIELAPYPAFGGGVAMRFKACQVVELAGGAQTQDVGFGASGGSYKASDDVVPADSPDVFGDDDDDESSEY